ncbi:hypothetical protein KC345_g2708 [Hortaea werneckii]|nr:hypothetical protein KC345_g2708 [Hortaea werneckii]
MALPQSPLAPAISQGSIQDPNVILLKEPELLASPMEDIHKDLALLHFRRLQRVLDARDPTALPVYSSRAAAYEQLVRMTDVVRVYLARAAAEEEMREQVSESMIADVVETCLGLDNPGRGAVGGGEACFGSGAMRFPDVRGGKEGEGLTQEPHTHTTTLGSSPVDQLRSPPPEAAQSSEAFPLPPEIPRTDLGSQLDWAGLLHRSRSEDNLLHRDRQGRHFQVLETRERIRHRLLRPVENRNGISWPPP